MRQSQLCAIRKTNRYKFGILAPRTWKETVQIDRENGNTLWQDAIKKDLAQIMEYKTFRNLGLKASIPIGFKLIRFHFVFDVKFNPRRKARLVAGGHLTDPPKDSTYSGVVSLCAVRMQLLIAELNGLTTWTADVGNAYLKAETKEKVVIVAGPEFGPEFEGCLLQIVKALYGLKSSGSR